MCYYIGQIKAANSHIWEAETIKISIAEKTQTSSFISAKWSLSRITFSIRHCNLFHKAVLAEE